MSTLRVGYFLDIDGSPLQDDIIGMGSSGVVVRRGNLAAKLPLASSTAGLGADDIEYVEIRTEISRECLRQEISVYRRLGHHDGIVSYVDLADHSFTMALMNENLREYLARHTPSKHLGLAWFQRLAHALVYIHERRVLAADITARNLLLSTDLSIQFSDFNNSSIFPLDTNMQDVDDAGYSIYTDIGQFGTVMYEVLSGERCEFDLYKGQPLGQPARAAWPTRDDLPSTQNIWLGSIIERCWTKGAFKDTRELSVALDTFTICHPSFGAIR